MLTHCPNRVIGVIRLETYHSVTLHLSEVLLTKTKTVSINYILLSDYINIQ